MIGKVLTGQVADGHAFVLVYTVTVYYARKDVQQAAILKESIELVFKTV